MKKAKKCPVCKSRELKWVYYAPPAEQAPDIWEDMVDVGYQPMILAKRIECRKCGATVPGLTLTLDDAVKYWNAVDKNGKIAVIQKIGEENVSEVEV